MPGQDRPFEPTEAQRAFMDRVNNMIPQKTGSDMEILRLRAENARLRAQVEKHPAAVEAAFREAAADGYSDYDIEAAWLSSAAKAALDAKEESPK